MKNRLTIVIDRIRSSYWFVPAFMAVLAVVLSLVTIEIDKSLDDVPAWIVRIIYVDSAESARAVLSTVASSMITVAGVVFSLTMVVLSLTSQQYGPLVLGHFMRDRGNQFVLGIFTSTFVYCLLILRTIRGGEDNVLVPHVSVMTGLGLSILSLAMLIYFIHHVAESIQSNSIIERVSADLLRGIDELFPEGLGHEEDPDAEIGQREARRRLESEGMPLRATGSGYLQIVDDERLFEIARAHDLIVRTVERPGHFFVQGDVLAWIIPAQRLAPDTAAALERAFVLGTQRSATQDIEYRLIPLVSMAVRALSPGINDPQTAIVCVDRIIEALAKLLHRRMPSRYRYDDTDRLRVISDPLPFEALFETAFDQIRFYGGSDIRVAVHLMTMIGRLGAHTHDKTKLRLFAASIDAIYQRGRAALSSPVDLRQLDAAFARAATVSEIDRWREPADPHPRS